MLLQVLAIPPVYTSRYCARVLTAYYINKTNNNAVNSRLFIYCSASTDLGATNHLRISERFNRKQHETVTQKAQYSSIEHLKQA